MMRSLAMILCIAVIASCAGDDPGSDSPACDALSGAVYLSVDELECGLGPDGPVPCRWRIAFDSGSYTWQYSDIGDSGVYTCAGVTVTGTSAGGTSYTGTLGDDGATLTWDGVAYTRDGSALTRTSRR